MPFIFITHILKRLFAQAGLLKEGEFGACQWPGHSTRIVLGIAPAADNQQLTGRGDERGDTGDGTPAQGARQSLNGVNFQHEVESLLPPAGGVKEVRDLVVHGRVWETLFAPGDGIWGNIEGRDREAAPGQLL